MYDTLLLQGMRAKLVLLLKEKGITDQKVLDSIGKVPRHLFTDRSLERIAYEDRSLEILCSPYRNPQRLPSKHNCST